MRPEEREREQRFRDSKKADKEKSKWNPFNNTLFSVCFSFLTAIVLWFAISAESLGSGDQPLVLQDVAIEIEYSDAAASGGLHIYDQNELTADVKITAGSNIKNRLTNEDVSVVGVFSPSSIKTSGTGLNTATVTLKAIKNNTLADYNIEEISPSEIVVEYDRSSEIQLNIEDDIQRSAQTGYWIGVPVFSEKSVVVSGPESYVKQLTKAAVQREIPDMLSEDKVLTEPIKLYGQDSKEIRDYKNLYLTMSTDEVEVTLPVLMKKTLPLVVTYNGKPDGYTESRVTIDPATIDIAGSKDVVDKLSSITLDSPISFSDVTFEENSFTREIPLPANVQNLNNIETATVELNLNGFKQTTKTTTNIKLVNPPSDRVEATTKSLSVTVIGSESQIAKLTGDAIEVKVDMSGWTEESGSMDLPAKVSIKGFDTCWAVRDDHSVTVDLLPQETASSAGGDSPTKAVEN